MTTANPSIPHPGAWLVPPDPAKNGYAYLKKEPSKKFREALFAAQQAGTPLVRDTPMQGRGMYSSAEAWLKAATKLFHEHGLMATQSGSLQVIHAFERVVFCAYHVETTVQLVEDGTGWVYTMDVPLWGDRGTPQHSTFGSLSSAFKYGFRGVLMLGQISEAEELEGETVEQAEARKARSEENKRALEKRKAAQQPTKAAPAAPAEEPPERVEESAQELALAEIRDLAAGLPPGKQARIESMIPASVRTKKLDKLKAHVVQLLQEQQKPVEDEEIVQAAKRLLSEEGQAEEAPISSEDGAPLDGGTNPSLANILAKGWSDTGDRKAFAESVCALPANEPFPAQAKPQFFNWVALFFDGDNDAAHAAWEGCGYKPEGKNGPQPLTVHVKRYLLKLDWKSKQKK